MMDGFEMVIADQDLLASYGLSSDVVREFANWVSEMTPLEREVVNPFEFVEMGAISRDSLYKMIEMLVMNKVVEWFFFDKEAKSVVPKETVSSGVFNEEWLIFLSC